MTIEIILRKAKCPICNHMFEQWYCPSCGLPISTTDRRRPEYNHFENYQLCSECNTSNPYGAKFCRSCGKSMSSQAKDRNGHGWVDLGLSVLWSTEAVDGYYYWMDIVNIMEHNICGKIGYNYRQEDDLEKRILAGKDTAAYKWGHKWRMPTKEEFQELIEKCSWELVMIPSTNKHHLDKTTLKALKVTGPNGNHIYLPALGEANGSYIPDWTYRTWHPKISNTGFKYWSSTKEINNDNTQTYVFKPRIIGLSSDMSETLKEKILESHRLLFRSSTPIDERLKLFMHTEYIYKSGNYRAYVVRPVADKKWKGKL